MVAVTEPVVEGREVQALLRRIWAAIVRYRRMVAAMIGFSLLQVICTKLPFMVIEPLISVLEESDGSGSEPRELPADAGYSEELRRWFSDWFRGFADDLCALLGLSFEAPGMPVVVACGFVTLCCGIVGAVTIYMVQTVSRFFAYRVVADLRSELAHHFLSLPLRFFGRQRMGDMISRVTNDTQVMQRSFEMAADNVVVDPLMILGNVLIIAFYFPQALLVVAVMLPFMAIPMYRQGKKVQKRSTSSLRALGETTESLNQILTGIRTVKAYQLEDECKGKFDETTVNFLARTRRVLRAKGRSIAQSFIGYQVATAVILVLLGHTVLSTDLTFAVVAVIIAPLATNYQHVKRVTRAYNVIRESAGALAGIEVILGAQADQTMVGGEPVGKIRGDVEVRDVHFAYDDKPVLSGVTLSAKAGQTIALVGESGGGKSTIMDLLMRFHDPVSGNILLDGKDLRDIRLSDYRRQTAVVSQEPFLFNATLRENIACGKPDASQAEIEAAARAANIHEFIVNQPGGYDASAGERGGNLSGGQMQRVTIARAILRDPAILFLDEATSALDTDSEEAVKRALDTLREGRTSFVIAHRLSTIVDADQICVIEDGQVVETGSHAQLLAQGGVYKRMSDKQMRQDG